MNNHKVLTIGYYNLKLDYIKDIQISNFNLLKITNRRITNLKRRLENKEFKLTIVVISEHLLKYLQSEQDISLFHNIIDVIKNYKNVILIKETILDETPTFYDFKERRHFNLKDVNRKIKEIESLIKVERNLNNKKIKELDTSEIINNEIDEEYAFKLSSLKFDLDIIYIKQRQLEGWLSTYRDHKQKLIELNLQKPLIQNILETVNSIEEGKYTFRFYKDIVSLVKDEIIDALKDELFNFYITHDSFYAQEFEDFIQLFEKYLRSIEGIEINLDIQKTKKGVLYVIRFTNKDLQDYDISRSLENFNEFLDLCNNSPDLALEIIELKIQNTDKALEIIQAISKKYKRLVLDIQQQKERIQLSIKQELQADLLELNISETPLSLLNKDYGIGSLTNFSVNPTIQNKLLLSRKYDEHELKLIKLVEKYSEPSEIVNVKSNIDKIKDDEINDNEKENSIYKLKKVLKVISSKVFESSEKIAIEILTKYLEGKLF